MGNIIYSYNHVDQLVNKSCSVIDLRSYIKTIKNYNNDICNVYIGLNYKDQYSRYKNLYIHFTDILYSLGNIISREIFNNNSNETIITVENGRKYIVFTYIPEIDNIPNIIPVELNKFMYHKYN